RRRRRGRERVVPARAARLPDGAAARKPPRGRAEAGVPHEDLLRPAAEAVEARGVGAPEPDAAGRGPAAPALAAPAGTRPRSDAARRDRPDVPQHDRAG